MLDEKRFLDFSSAVHRLLDDKQKALLASRLGKYLDRNRRGRLNLPKWFPKPFQALRDLSRAQIAKWAYWTNSSMSTYGLVSTSTAGFLHRAAPGGIWTRTSVSLVQKDQSEVVKRLPRRLAPRVASAVWPSTPDIFEMLEMSRRGISIPSRDKVPITVKDCLSRRAVSDDIRIATLLVRQQIVGLRSSVEVPRKFLGHFRRLHGFLILTTRFSIPAGLVRFLLAQWVCCPTSLWLVQPISFKSYLKRYRASDFIREASCAVPEPLVPVSLGGEGNPKPVEEPVDNWSIYWPRLHLFQETSIAMEITRQGCWPSRSKTKKGPPFAVR